MDPSKVDVAFMECVFVAMCRLCIAIIIAALLFIYYAL